MISLLRFDRPLRLILWIGLVCAALATSLRVRQIDLWWQLPEGLALLAHGSLPTQAPAAFGLPPQPYVDEYALYEIALALVYRAGGFPALSLVFSLVYLAIFFVAGRAARIRPPDVVGLGLVAVAILFLMNRMEQRPEIPGLLCLALLLELLRRTTLPTPGFLLRLAVLMAVWSNLHSTYLVGLAAVFLWLGERVVLARALQLWPAIGIGALATLCATIHPYGWRRIAFTWAEQVDLGSNVLSVEMWPLDGGRAMAAVFLGLAVLLLMLACVGEKRPPRWLIAHSVLALLLSLHGLRYLSLVAVAMLAVFAARQHAPVQDEDRTPRRLAAFRVFLLFGGCLAILLFDVAAIRQFVSTAWNTHGRDDARFAPDLVARLRERCAGSTGVLCECGDGAYLTFAGDGKLRPLLDSGQGHFDDATKRAYFCLVYVPEAFDLALDRLAVKDVFVTRAAAGWAPLLARRLDWHLVDGDEHGLIFERATQPMPPTGDEIERLTRLRDDLVQQKSFAWAFAFDVAIAPPAEALALLDCSSPGEWSEPFLNAIRVWIDGLADSTVEQFFRAHPRCQNPLLGELVRLRLNAPGSIGSAPRPLLERELYLTNLLRRNDLVAARREFERLSPEPASARYEELHDEIEKRSGAGLRALSPREKWQDWNAGGRALLLDLVPRLNRKIDSPAWTADSAPGG